MTTSRLARLLMAILASGWLTSAVAAEGFDPGAGLRADALVELAAPGGHTGLQAEAGFALRWEGPIAWGRRGAISCLISPSREMRFQPEGQVVVPVIEASHLRLELLEHGRHCELVATMPAADGTEYRGSLQVGFLRSDRWYHVAISWDVDQPWMRIHVDGLDAGDLFHWKKQAASPVPPVAGSLAVGGVAGDAADHVAIAVAAVQVHDDVFAPETLAEQWQAWALPPVLGEVRSLSLPGIDLTGFEGKLIESWEDLSQFTVGAEDDLFDDRERALLPTTDWVLEGPGTVTVVGDALRLTVDDTSNRKDGHLVLWRDRVFPGDLLVEYEFRPKLPAVGLHILFFSYLGDQGDSIFDLRQQRRGGRFKHYTKSTLNGYHCSLWSGDDQESRLTANLRKNSGFMMPVIGTDRVAEDPAHRWYPVRLAKIGGTIRFEVDGKPALAFDDDGTTYGPVWGDGYLGWRVMAHSEQFDIRKVRISALKATPPSP